MRVVIYPTVPARLDAAIAAGSEVSRRAARRLIEEGAVLLNNHPVAVASRPVSSGDRIAIASGDPGPPVLACGDGWIAVDKPAGVATHPGREDPAVSLLELVGASLKSSGQRSDLFVVHRLDTGTSGVLLFATNRRSAAALSLAFARGSIEKRYLALVEGRLDGQERIDAPIIRVAEDRFGVDPGGRAAVSIVVPIAASSAATLVAVDLQTGRTHQIRVHLSSRSHPLYGDRKYGGGGSDRFARPMLHALRLRHPLIGTVVAMPPDDFRDAARSLGLPDPAAGDLVRS